MTQSDSKTVKLQRWRSTRRLLPWSLSLILHAALIPFFLPVSQTQASKSPMAPHTPAPLRLLSTKQAQRLLKPKPKPKPKVLPLKKVPKAPVVSLSRITEEVAQNNARFLATINNRTRRETRAQQSGLPAPAASKKQPKHKRASTQKAQQRAHKSRAEKSLRESKNGRFSAQDPTNDNRDTKRAAVPLQRMASLDRILHQSAAQSRNRFIPKGTPEALHDVPVGDETILNTRAYKHGWFFNRVIGALYQNWKVQEAHRSNDPSGKVYGIRDRHTVVYAILNRRGELIHIEVSKSSGAPHLDDEAIAAFHRAQPFPNPPAELVNEKGHIEFPMGFNLRLGEPEFFRLR